MTTTYFIDGTTPIVATWLNDVNTTTYSTVPSLSTSVGSTLVGYTNGNTGTTSTTVSAKLKQTISILDFGADPTGVVACDTALANACAYIASNKAQLVFPAGTYKYSTSPNWGINNADITTDGVVVLNYTGTGYAVNIDAGNSVEVVYNLRFAGNFIVQSNALALDAVFVRSIHHSKISLRVSGCGPTYAGVRIKFSVCTEYNIVVSSNEGFVSGAKPYYGIYCDARATEEQTSACIFNNPIIEGVGGNGIELASAIQNTFTGGTSEGNTGFGIRVTSSSTYNTFNKLDMEANVAGDIKDDGGYNTYNGCYSSSTSSWLSAYNAVVSGGTYNNIVNTGLRNSFINATFANNGGTLTNTGTNTTVTNLFNNTSATYNIDAKHASVGPNVVSVATGVSTTVLTLPSTGTNYYQVLVYLQNVGDTAHYSAYAVVAQDLSSARIMSQVNGSDMTISLVGLAIKATQTSGVVANVTAFASAI